MRLTVELINRSNTIPMKSCQSGALPSPFDRAIATIAAPSMTHERGFHMKLRNCRRADCSFASSLLWPKIPIRSAASASVRPVSRVWRRVQTSSRTTCSRSTLSLSYYWFERRAGGPAGSKPKRWEKDREACQYVCECYRLLCYALLCLLCEASPPPQRRIARSGFSHPSLPPWLLGARERQSGGSQGDSEKSKQNA